MKILHFVAAVVSIAGARPGYFAVSIVEIVARIDV